MSSRLQLLSLAASLGLGLAFTPCCAPAADVPSATAEWPQFRGPNGQGQALLAKPPLTWSETNRVTWKTAIPGEGWSSPVIEGGRLYFTSALEGGKSLCALAVDGASGKILWQQEVLAVEAPEFKHTLNSYASPTPIISQGRLYVTFGTYGTACLEAGTGKVLWRNDELKLGHENGPGSSPALFEDKLILPCDGTNVQYLVALDTATGKVAWKTDRSGVIDKAPPMKKAYSTPLLIRVNGQDQVVTPAAEYVYSYDPRTGKELWRVHHPGFSNVPRPLFANGLIYVCTGFGKPELWAIRPDGQGDVSATHVAWKSLKQAPAKPSPVIFGDNLYMISDSGMATCLDARTGQVHWQERLGGGEYSASPVATARGIYFFSQDGVTTVIDPSPTFQTLATNRLSSGFMGSPAVVGNTLFLRTKTDLYRVE